MKTRNPLIKNGLTVLLIAMSLSCIKAQYLYILTQNGFQEYKPEKTKKRKRKEEDSEIGRAHV